MNQEQLEGKWKQFKGSFKEKWGKISNDKLEQAEGKKDKLVGLLQENYGFTKEKAEDAYDEWVKRLDNSNSLETVWNKVQGRWTELWGHFETEYGATVEDQVAAAKGERDTLAGIVQAKQNISLGEAYEIVDSWAHKSTEEEVVTPKGR